MNLAGPYGCYQIFSVFFFTIVSLFLALFINIVAFFDLYTGIHIGNKTDAFRLHFLDEFREIGESFGINGKHLEILHIIYIHIDHIKRDSQFFVTRCNFSDVIRSLISPSALPVSESPHGRDITLAYQFSERTNNLNRCFSFYNIKRSIIIFGMNTHDIHVSISDIKSHTSGIIYKDTKTIRTIINDQEVL